MMVVDKVAAEWITDDLLEAVIVDVDPVFLGKDDHVDVDGHWGWMTPKSLISILAPKAWISCQRMFCG